MHVNKFVIHFHSVIGIGSTVLVFNAARCYKLSEIGVISFDVGLEQRRRMYRSIAMLSLCLTLIKGYIETIDEQSKCR